MVQMILNFLITQKMYLIIIEFNLKFIFRRFPPKIHFLMTPTWPQMKIIKKIGNLS